MSDRSDRSDRRDDPPAPAPDTLLGGLPVGEAAVPLSQRSAQDQQTEMTLLRAIAVAAQNYLDAVPGITHGALGTLRATVTVYRCWKRAQHGRLVLLAITAALT